MRGLQFAIFLSAIIAAVLAVSGCVCPSDTPDPPMPPYFPSASPSTPPMPPAGETIWGTNVFTYDYNSQSTDMSGKVHETTSVREYTYEDVTLPDGSPGYKMTLNEWFSPGNGYQYSALYKKDNTFVNGTRAGIRNNLTTGSQPVQGSTMNMYNPKAWDALKGDYTVVGTESLPGWPNTCTKYDVNGKGTSVWLDDNAYVPVKIVAKSPCGSFLEEFNLWSNPDIFRFGPRVNF